MRPQLSPRSKNYALGPKLSMRRTADQMPLHVERVVNRRVNGNKALSLFG
jgi:hypothetical protein